MGTRTPFFVTVAFALVAAFAVAFPVAIAQDSAATETASPTDAEITTAVVELLLTADGIAAHRIDVTTDNGVVEMDGTVDTLLAKQRAAELALTVKGVRSVVTDVEIAGEWRSDQAIREDVVDALEYDPAVEYEHIRAEVTNRKVTLTGKINSRAEGELAREAAAGVRGVIDVESTFELRKIENRTDEEIEAEVESVLASSVWINSEIGVGVSDGVVTLAGEVRSAAARDIATSLARVIGVERVNTDNLEIDWYAENDRRRAEMYADWSDSRVENALIDALVANPRVSIADVEVSVEENLARLSGIVSTLHEKRAAESIANHTRGVWSVVNQLRVRPDVEPSDDAIERRIEDAFLRDPYVNRFDVSITVRNGHVSLFGDVETSYTKERAENLAAQARGVVQVANFIEVMDSVEPMSDWEIEMSVENELFWSPFVDEDTVFVEVEDGVVTLTGTVDTWHEWQLAEENAYQGGAVAVDNDLTVVFGPEVYTPDFETAPNNAENGSGDTDSDTDTDSDSDSNE